MKKLNLILSALFLFAFSCAVMATDYPVPQNGSTVNATNSYSLGTTNTTIYTNSFNVEKSTYHTLLTVITSTNSATVNHDYSIDGATWFPFWTNTTSNPGGNFQTNLTGKWVWFRQRVSGSNVTATVTYLGGR